MTDPNSNRTSSLDNDESLTDLEGEPASVSSPIISNLPEEILSLIFLEAFEELEGIEYLGCPTPSSALVPLNVSWVCSRWRQAAILTPQLWTSVTLMSDKKIPTVSDRELLKLYISRSGDVLPLSFVIDYRVLENIEDPKCMKEGQKTMQQIIETLKKVQNRWQVLAVCSPFTDSLYDYIDCLRHGAPSLEYLSLSSSEGLTNQRQIKQKSNENTTIDLRLCPQLSAVSLFNPRHWVTLNPLQSSDPLKNLTSLELEHTRSQPDAFDWLLSCPYLEYLTIRFYAARPFALPFAPILTLQQLTHFALRCYSGQDDTDPEEIQMVDSDPVVFLSLLKLPALRNLSLYMNGQVEVGPREPWPHVRELLQRSDRPQLTSLELLGTPMYASDLVEVLQITPSLKDLCVDGGLTTEGFCQLLSHTPDQALLCPSLESLRLYGYYREFEPLVKMVTSRSHRSSRVAENSEEVSSADIDDLVSTLKTLTLVYRKDAERVNIEENSGLSSLRSNGTNINQSRMSPLLWYNP